MKAQRGFTLTEITIAFLIMSLLLAGFMYTLQAQTTQRERADTQRRLEEAKQLLIGFAIVNGRLPCPAVAPPTAPYNNPGATGVESPAGGACTDGYTGFLPARDIGFQPADENGYGLDAWNMPIRYAISKNSSVAGSPDWNFTTAGAMKTNGIGVLPSDLVICAEGANVSAVNCNTEPYVTSQNVVVAVVWSHGKNFAERVTVPGVATPNLGADELPNFKLRQPAVLNDTPVFVRANVAPAGAPGGEYDDMMAWIPVGELYARLVAAGVLP
jgi:prepilin-type N-terminal cleavage/methylation domain-containing protein